jgi:hypothetical protein
MKIFFRLTSGIALATMLVIGVRSAEAQLTCIQASVSSTTQPSLGFAPSDVVGLVTQVASAIGLSPNGISIIPCDGIRDGEIKAQSIYLDRPDLKIKGDFILYDPTWIRELIGNDREQAIVIFGHELGHLLDRDWTTNRDLPKIKKETNADHFAGCAAGALGVAWGKVQDVLSRIRADVDTDYPSREHSLAAAKIGFDACLRRTPKLLDEKGLVSWWKADGNLSDTQGHNNGTIHGTISFEQGKIGRAFGFRGDGFISMSTTSLPANDSDRTVAFWLLMSKGIPDADQYWASNLLVGYGSFGNPAKSYQIGFSREFGIMFTNWGSAISTGLMPQLGQWYHIAVTNQANKSTLYVNGNPAGQGSFKIDTRMRLSELDPENETGG